MTEITGTERELAAAVQADALPQDTQDGASPAPQETAEAALARREAEVTRRELRVQATETLGARGLPPELADVLDYADAHTLEASLQRAERAFRAAVRRGMADRMRGEPPRVGADPDAALLDRVRQAAGLRR